MSGAAQLDAVTFLFPLDPARSLSLFDKLRDMQGVKVQLKARLLALMYSEPSTWPLLPPD